MTDTRPYNEPAYPVPDCSAWQYGGMSLQDFFAGQIALGLTAFSGTQGAGYGPEDIAQRSYEVASAMLVERGKQYD